MRLTMVRNWEASRSAKEICYRSMAARELFISAAAVLSRSGQRPNWQKLSVGERKRPLPQPALERLEDRFVGIMLP